MSFFYRLGQSPVKLFIIAQILILLTFIWRDFPVSIFLAFAPIFALIDHPSGLKDSYLAFLVAVGTALVFYYSLQQSRVISWVIYFTMLAAIFTSYPFIQKWSQNSLNKFALIIFMLGMEYLFLKLMINNNPVFLADLLAPKMEWTRWNIFTGYTGATLWILITNLLFYYALFKEKKINWLLLGLGIFLIVSPMVYSLNLTYNALTKADAISFYSVDGKYDSTYPQHGELISRAGAWVSVLIIIFTLIKGKTKKVSR